MVQRFNRVLRFILIRQHELQQVFLHYGIAAVVVLGRVFRGSSPAKFLFPQSQKIGALNRYVAAACFFSMQHATQPSQRTMGSSHGYV